MSQRSSSEREGPYSIAATLPGRGVVRWEGEVSLNPLASSGRFEVRGFRLGTAWRFVQDNFAMAEPAGRLDADLRCRLTYQDRGVATTPGGSEQIRSSSSSVCRCGRPAARSY
jgi:hypothetical protein